MQIKCQLKSIIICLFVLTAISPLMAAWEDPILLNELNDYENGFAASRPSISADESILFFVRPDATGQSRVWEAQRNPETGVFDNQRVLTELRKEGRSVYGTWISEDNNRLYYSGHNSNWSKRQIWMATRNDSSQRWSNMRLHSELEIEDMLVSCSLTADECYIMYGAASKDVPAKIFFATRNSKTEAFSSPQEAIELNAIGADSPTITPDGLTVYFFIPIDPINTGLQEMWVGYRESMNEPFGNFMPVDEINSNGHSVMGWASPSWDGQRLYYLQRNAQPGTPGWILDATGIFVSHWVDPPEVVVDKNLTGAIEAKNEILEQLGAVIEKEIETLEILNILQKMTERRSKEFCAIQKTKHYISKALRDEIFAQYKIRSSIRELEKAQSHYRMEEQEQPQHRPRRHGKKAPVK